MSKVRSRDCASLEQLRRNTPCPTSGAVAMLHWISCVETPQVQNQKNSSKTVGTAAAVRRYSDPTETKRDLCLSIGSAVV